MNLSSEWRQMRAGSEQVFSFVSDLRNVGALMPEQVVNWQADADNCSFTVKGMTSLKLKVDERRPHQLLRLIPDGKSPFEFELLVHIREKGELSDAMVELQAELNPMMAMMAKRPLQNLVNHIADSLSTKSF